MIYIITFIFIIGLHKVIYPNAPMLTSKIVYNRSRWLYHVLISVWFILLMVLRHDYVGSDTQNYRQLYDYIQSFGFEYDLNSILLSTEFGFYYLNVLLTQAGCSFRVLLLICALIYMGSISYLIYRYSQTPWLSYFIFLTFGYFIFVTTMRQCFALSFTIIAIQFAISRKLIPYFIFVLLAISFHATAIVFIPVYWIIQLPLKKRTAVLLGLGLLIIIVFIEFIFSYAIGLIGKEYTPSETSGYLTLVMYSLLVVIGCMVVKKMPLNNKYWLFLLGLVLCYMPIAKMNPALFRINLYFAIYIIIFLVNMIKYVPIAYRQLLLGVIFILGIYQFAYLAPRILRIYPYVFYWEDYPDAKKRHLD